MEKLVSATVVSLVLLAACGGDTETAEQAPAAEATPTATPIPTETVASPAPTDVAEAPAAEGTPTSTDAPVSLEGTVNNRGVARLQEDALEMELDDFYFEPTFIQAGPGATAALTLHNQGDVEHTFTIEALGIDEVLPPGQEVEVEVTLPEELPQRFICRFHEAQGMQGAFFSE